MFHMNANCNSNLTLPCLSYCLFFGSINCIATHYVIGAWGSSLGIVTGYGVGGQGKGGSIPDRDF
jgi:hypothetical protein